MKRYRNKQTGEVVEACRVDTKKFEHVIYNNSHDNLELQVCCVDDYYVRAPSGITAFYPPEKFRETFEGAEEAVRVVLLGERCVVGPAFVFQHVPLLDLRAKLISRGDGTYECTVQCEGLEHRFSSRSVDPKANVARANRFAADMIRDYLATGEWSWPC